MGDNPEPPSGDTHPQNLDTIYKQNKATHADLAAIQEELRAIRALLEQRPA